jgi:MOSC domain-containing protein YiiM
MTGRLEGIWIKRAKGGPMDWTDQATLVADRGILGNADQGGRRQVTIIESETWDRMMEELDARVDPSARRANLMVRGTPLTGARGRILTVGGCRIQIMGETRPCEQMDEALPGLRRAMASPWRGGAFGVILDGGEIRVGDPVELEPATARGPD